ncbi:endonuclease NucS [Bacillus cereus]|uniref:endonuclease NucS domain-containing protein n=1 Tax=Bacillus TaxID=1386 RepID=UPI002ABFD301|nr:endonuclease NucS domain-containing protein [Bacillus cereus]MDZ4454640.1 endonuclease NucS [Bacillus cereus]
MEKYYYESVNLLIEKDFVLNNYSCIKVEYRQHEEERYYVYGFSNSLPEWELNKGDLLFITKNRFAIEQMEQDIFVLDYNDVFCKECFRKKDVAKLSDKNTRYWMRTFWDKTPQRARERLQNDIMRLVPDADWLSVKPITDKSRESPSFLYGICSTYCISKEVFEESMELQSKSKQLTDIWREIIADEVLNGSESLLEDFLVDYIEILEEDMEFIERQRKVENGVIDILAKDKNGILCIIELKVNESDKNLVWQSAYYPTCFQEETRIITIAPKYNPKIYNALKNVKNVEIKVISKNEKGLLQITNFEENIVTDCSTNKEVIEIKDAI